MKLNFKALVASLVLCSSLFSTLPVYNNSISAMKPDGFSDVMIYKDSRSRYESAFIESRESGARIYCLKRNGKKLAIYGINANGGTLEVILCSKKVLRKDLLSVIIHHAIQLGANPEILFVGKGVEHITVDAFDNMYMYNENTGRGRIKKVVVYSGSTLDEKIREELGYYSMCRDLTEETGLKFYYTYRDSILEYDYIFDVGNQRQAMMNHHPEMICERWTDKEIRILKEAIRKATNGAELINLAREGGIDNRSDHSILSAAYRIGWRVRN